MIIGPKLDRVNRPLSCLRMNGCVKAEYLQGPDWNKNLNLKLQN